MRLVTCSGAFCKSPGLVQELLQQSSTAHVCVSVGQLLNSELVHVHQCPDVTSHFIRECKVLVMQLSAQQYGGAFCTTHVKSMMMFAQAAMVDLLPSAKQRMSADHTDRLQFGSEGMAQYSRSFTSVVE